MAPFWRVGGERWPQGPQAAERVARDQSPSRGITAGNQLAPKTDQSLGAKPGPQSPERGAQGWDRAAP